MLSTECQRELRSAWLPHTTDAGLNRLIELLEKASPLLIHGCFSRAMPMGCLATHIAWNHPRTACYSVEAGINWLHHVAGLNPATSLVIREWDRRGAQDFEMRADLLEILADERRRRDSAEPSRRSRELVEA